MSGSKCSSRPTDMRAAQVLQELMAARGWVAQDLADETAKPEVGHPVRKVSKRTVYRVVCHGWVPSVTSQFEIAQAFGLVPAHIWGRLPIPDEARYATDLVAA